MNAINPLSYPQFPKFEVENIEVDDHIVSFALVADELVICLTTSLTVEISDTASMQHPYAEAPYDGWYDVTYSYPQLNALSICRVTDSQDVSVTLGDLISLTEQQIHFINEEIYITAAESV